ncbi:hypothetical protein [Actinobaculum sp. 352]|uniref:hypothetical protein n=1 Tax=Actinobaculum sp. 352 TaxID=2490946 RepID=UPI000F7DF06C|nr:hypothetical protein [Actinobaculum sp. 352]RTE49062.1 hypothetical protein EKN07_08015 [Actinobaculum sp. 352]
MRGIRLRRQPTEPEPAAEPGTSTAPDAEAAWQSVELPRNHVRMRTALRVIIAGALVLLAGLGVRSAVAGPTATVAAPQTIEASEPDAAAVASTAEYVARAWLTLDDPSSRASRLSRAWDEPGTAGWSGEGGLETRGSTYVVATEVVDEDVIDVTVAVYVAGGEDGPAGWVGVLVPMQLVDGRASVRAEPKLVGVPDPARLPAVPLVEEDRTLTGETRSDVDRFFTAWASGDATGVTAPGVEIPTPPAGLAAAELTAWTVTAGSGDTRSGTATVRLTIGQATITSTYQVEITRVTTSDGADRWQVTNIS